MQQRHVETEGIDAGIMDRLHSVGSIYANDHAVHYSAISIVRYYK